MKTFCPICSDILLRHIYQNKISWLCLRCRQEMPNFDLFELSTIKEKSIQSDFYLNHSRIICLRTQSQNNVFLINHKSIILDLSVELDRKRLEVVSFILHKINIILINTFTDVDQYVASLQSESKQLNIKKPTANTLIKADFLRDSEAILCCICQAILFADRNILNHMILKGYSTKSINCKLPVEQSCFIDLIKTLVIDFIYSITLDSNQRINYFALEVASYFELVISLIIERQECYG